MNLNESQELAVKDTSSRLLILAGAGTGKTTVMLQRIKRLVDEGISPSHILALTFTNAAANEMSSRFISLVGNKSIPKFSTFHAFCYQLLDNYRVSKRIGYTNIPTITDEAAIQNIQKSVKINLNIQLSLPRLLNPPDSLSFKDKDTVAIYHKALQKEYNRQNLISFDLLIQRVSDLFINHDDCVKQYHDMYEYIFVDEFQDTDKLQWDFCQSFGNSSLFVVGDALQAIYGFRGADNTIIKELASDSSWKTIKLYENYRSTEDIVDFANNMSTYADDTYRVILKSDKPGLPVIQITDDRERYGDTMSLKMLKSVADFCTSYEGTSAILCRTNSEVSEVTEYLSMRDIEYCTSDPNKTKIDILKSVNDTEYMLNWWASNLNDSDFRLWINSENMKKSETDTEDTVLSRFLDMFGSRYTISSSKECIDKIREVLSFDSNPFDTIRAIYDILELGEIAPNTDASTPEEIVEYILINLETTITNSLYVGTIHSSKGLEYEAVALIGVNSPTFELKNEDNKNLYYVGITRAKNYLLIASGDKGGI